jgi:hypothetical protein
VARPRLGPSLLVRGCGVAELVVIQAGAGEVRLLSRRRAFVVLEALVDEVDHEGRVDDPDAGSEVPAPVVRWSAPSWLLSWPTGRTPTTAARASRRGRRSQAIRVDELVPRQILLICVVVVLAALGLRRGAWRLRLDAALAVAATLVLLIVASVLLAFSYRYRLLAILLLPPVVALAVTSMLRRHPSRSDLAQTS